MFPRQAAALLALVPLIAWSCRDPSGPSVATILVTPPDAELVVGDALLLRAVGLSADGDTLRELQITWTSADTAVAVVSPAGLVTGRGQGTVVIRAASEGVQGQADLTVNVHFATVTTGIYHICGLNSEGSAYCWGANLFGELGNGTSAPQSAPRAVVGNHRFRVIAAGGYFTCGLATDSLAWCWGSNGAGTLGIGVRDTLQHPVPLAVVGNHHFQHLAAAENRVCGVTSTGLGYCWGRNQWGANGTELPTDSSSPTPQPLTGNLTFSMIETVYGHTCGVSVAQAAYCWGGNGSGELGHVTDSAFTTPVAVADTLVFSALAAGGSQACGLVGGGSALCWGTQEVGEGYWYRRSPEPVAPGVPLSRIAAAFSTACGLDQMGRAWCWGSNFLGEVGDGTTQTRSTPVRVIGGHVFSEIAVGEGPVCGVANGATYCWGSNYAGSLGRGFLSTYEPVPGLVAGGSIFTTVAAGTSHVCGLATDSTAWCWGSNYGGQLGDSTQIDRWQPVSVHGGLKLVAITVGGADSYHAHSCALTSGGAAYCWGNGANGQLGTGSTASSAFPVPVSGAQSFTRIAGGGLAYPFTCAIGLAGAAYCWGSNHDGTLGRGDTLSSNTPVAVAGSNAFEDIAAGNDFVCGRTALGKTYCWGRNTIGELGQGYLSIESKRAELVQGGHSFILVAVGQGHTCGLATDSTAWCWGRNTEGQLGTADQLASIAPRAVVGGLHFSSLSLGDLHSCALTASGAAYCWGRGGPAVPTQIQPGTVFQSLDAGFGSNICGIRADSLAVCLENPFGSRRRSR